MSNIALYKYHQDYGRMGTLEGVFIMDEDKYNDYVKGRSVWEFDILGKHSEVRVEFNDDTVTKLDVSDTTVADMLKVLGVVISGITPHDYFDQFAEQDEEDVEDE
jgi:hypothetical protein